MKIVAQKREEQGTGASRRLRKEGVLPGIVYGGDKEPVSIKLDQNTIYYAIADETFHATIHELEVDGVVEQVVLRDFQLHAFKQLVMHADFQRVSEDEKVTVYVPLRFENAANSPAVKLSGARVSPVMKSLEVTCLPKDLPESITVDLGHMVPKQTVFLEEISLPEGVEAPDMGKRKALASASKAR